MLAQVDAHRIGLSLDDFAKSVQIADEAALLACFDKNESASKQAFKKTSNVASSLISTDNLFAALSRALGRRLSSASLK